jgi:hypothetical protein
MINDELYINGLRVDLDASTNFAFSFSINDVKEPDKRSRSVSKTISIPGTQNNLNIFFSAYSLPQYFDPINPIGFDFDPRQTYESKYYVNNQLRFNGFAQIIKTKILNEVVTFEIVLFSNVVNFINQFGDIKISELGWDEYTHTLTHSNIAASWDTYVRVNGVITNNFTAGLPDGFGYYYALVDNGFGGVADEFEDNRIYPHLYQREILIKAFAFLGYTISGNFINSVLIKKAIIGIGGGEPPKLTSTELNNRLVDLEIDRIISATNTQTQSLGLALLYTALQTISLSAGATVVQDIKNQYLSPSVQIASKGNYRIIANGTIDYDLLIANTASGSFEKFIMYLTVFKNSGVQSSVETIILNTQVFSNTYVGTTSLFNVVLDLPLENGDVIDLKLSWDIEAKQYPDGNFGGLQIEYDTTGFIFKVEATDSIIVNGDDVNLAVFAPDIKVSEFVSSIIKQYNLQVDEPNDQRQIRIEPLENYYGTTSAAEDWSYKQDLTKDIEIEPIAVTQPKRFLYQYADDNDFYHALYKSLHGDQYGNLTFENPTIFAKGDSVIKMPYTVTPLVDIIGTDLTIPRIIDVKNSIVNPYKGKPRIYYINPVQTGDWTLLNSNVGTDTVYNIYPLAHHLDNISTPTVDLCFGTPIEVFYTATAYTTNNLFQKYFRRFINEFTSIDGRLLRSSFKLNEGDFIGNFFSKLKKIRGVIYRLNLISDTVLNDGNTSQVELVKVLESTAPRNYLITPPELVSNDQIADLAFTDGGTGGKVTFDIRNSQIRLTEGGVTKSATGVKYEFDGTISQTGTSAPTIDATGVNNLPSTITPTRTGVGTYRLTSVGSFSGVCTIQITNGSYNNYRQIIEAVKASDNILSINTYDLSAAADGILTNASINIKVY